MESWVSRAEILGENTEFASCLVPQQGKEERLRILPYRPSFPKILLYGFLVGQRNLGHLCHLLFRSGMA